MIADIDRVVRSNAAARPTVRSLSPEPAWCVEETMTVEHAREHMVAAGFDFAPVRERKSGVKLKDLHTLSGSEPALGAARELDDAQIVSLDTALLDIFQTLLAYEALVVTETSVASP